MSFGEAIRTVVGKYADFSGEARRSEFWWWVLFTALVAAACSLFEAVPLGDGASVGSILTGLWGLATLLPSLAVAVRRLRDCGRGWPNLLWALVPVVGLVVLVVLWAQPGTSR